MIIVSFGIIGFFLLPLHFLKMEPEAPISKLILFIMGDGENKGLRYLIASMSCLFIMGSLINVSNFEKDDKVQPVDADNPVNPPENSKNQPDD